MEKKHRGKILLERIEKSGMVLSRIAKSLGINRATLYARFKKSDLKGEFLIEVGKVIKHDFSVDFLELIPLKLEAIEKEGIEVFGNSKVEDLVKFQRKYIDLLEKNMFLQHLALDVFSALPLEKRKELKNILGGEGFRRNF